MTDVIDQEPPTLKGVRLAERQRHQARLTVAWAAIQGGWTREIPTVLEILGLDERKPIP